jgi:Transcriptional regulator containing an amidase domain and an AraC-type DNA-binding HTH domain
MTQRNRQTVQRVFDHQTHAVRRNQQQEQTNTNAGTMHQTLGEYIRQRRLLLAAQALRSTQRPIFDIAMDLGYVSQQTFSRVFRREFDRTPSDYRHQLN